MPSLFVNGIPLYYQIMGAGQPILWIQGLGADHTAWLGQLNAFSRSHRCVAFDNRDVGQSGRAEAGYAVSDMADDAAALVTGLGLHRVHLVGLSMGGAIAQELALTRPEMVRSLILVSSMARPDARLELLIGTWADIYPKVGTVDFYRQAMAWLYSYRFFERPRAISAFLRYSQSHPQDPAAFARQARASLAHDSVDRLGDIAAPTLVVAGEEDIMVPPRFARMLAGAIPGASLAIIPAAGHSVNIEQTALFNHTVREFLLKNV